MPVSPGRKIVLMNSLVRCVLFFFIVVFSVSIGYAQDVSVRAELSASTVTRDESVTLTITAIGIDAELDASSLDADFDVMGRSSSRQVSMVIGSDNRAMNTSVVTWALELLPRGSGLFTVPAVTVGDLETQLLTLTVNEVPKGAARDVFLEAEVDTSTPWVQSQVVMTLRVFQAIDIVDGGLDVPSADDLVVQRIGEDRSLRQTRDGREYNVTERRFALFPQKSGLLTIEPVTLSITVPANSNRARGFFSPTRKLTRRSDAITLDVQARPPAGAAWWLPATNVSLNILWQGDPENAQVDQPLTRTLVLRAEGVLDSQLPQINIPAVEGLSLYAEEPKRGMGEAVSGLISEQRINWALIPQRSGTLELPAISIEWFNTLTGEIEVTELPPESITVSPPSAESNRSDSNVATVPGVIDGNGDLAELSDSGIAAIENNAQPPQSLQPLSEDALSPITSADTLERTAQLAGLESSVQRWKLFAFAALGLWILSAIGWWVLRVRAGQSLDRKDNHSTGVRNSALGGQVGTLYQRLAPLSAVAAACKQGDLLDIKRSVIEWGALQWPEHTVGTLDDVQHNLPEGDARDKLSYLQSALYSRAGYSARMPGLVDDLASLDDELKSALQSIDGKSGNLSREGGRLPQL